MGAPVIRAEGLGKEYVIGAREAGRETFREMLTSSFAAPFRRFRRLSGAAAEERIWALKDVSFEVADGEVVGIIGRNGAGKSTLLKILSRITEPTEGRALLRGRVASLLEVGTGFHPELTGRENIHLNGAILGMSRAEIERKFDEIVAFAEIETFLDTPVKRYSSGMAVRLAFAVAAHLDPEILLVDEVLAVGDAAFQKKCLGKMEEFVERQGRTILLVSHNMAAIQVVATRAICLMDGKLVGSGKVDDQIRNYLSHIHGNAIVETYPKWLANNFSINEIILIPETITSGDSLDIEMTVYLESVEKIHDFSLLIYSSMGSRVCVLDLRQEDIDSLEFGTKTAQIKIRIPKLNLVAGKYDLGLYAHGSRFRGEFLNLKRFEVLSRSIRDDFVPYPSDVLGVVDIPFSASIVLR